MSLSRLFRSRQTRSISLRVSFAAPKACRGPRDKTKSLNICSCSVVARKPEIQSGHRRLRRQSSGGSSRRMFKTNSTLLRTDWLSSRQPSLTVDKYIIAACIHVFVTSVCLSACAILQNGPTGPSMPCKPCCSASSRSLQRLISSSTQFSLLRGLAERFHASSADISPTRRRTQP